MLLDSPTKLWLMTAPRTHTQDIFSPKLKIADKTLASEHKATHYELNSEGNRTRTRQPGLTFSSGSMFDWRSLATGSSPEGTVLLVLSIYSGLEVNNVHTIDVCCKVINEYIICMYEKNNKHI